MDFVYVEVDMVDNWLKVFWDGGYYFYMLLGFKVLKLKNCILLIELVLEIVSMDL